MLRPRRLSLLAAVILAALSAPSVAQSSPPPLPYPLTVPPGFQISVFVDGLPGVRFMALSPDGHLTVSRPRAGQVVVLPDRNGDGRADEVKVFAQGLDRPHGVAWREGALYVAETGAVLRLEDRNRDLVADGRRTILAGLPAGGMHWTRTLGFGPSGHIFVSVGSNCNACVEADPRRGSILRARADGTQAEIYARGLRNAVGFAWHPATGEMWATDNGRDLLGDDVPPDELNLVKYGGHYGWPYCYGRRIPDPEMGRPGFCRQTEPSALDFQAHSAALGIGFYRGSQFPEAYRQDAFVAFHGSWNRTQPTGYKVVRVRFQNGRPVGYEDFATGWLRGGKAWGRPVDVIAGRDGSLYVSDDAGGRIYRISYRR